jgi:hypothetical protein
MRMLTSMLTSIAQASLKHAGFDATGQDRTGHNRRGTPLVGVGVCEGLSL